jgi:3-oxoacyl-[acyl-carrier protein] reductase
VRLADRIALVTGAASGIGLATAERFVEEGARVVLADLDGDRASAAAEKLGGKARAIGVRCDVSVQQDCQVAVSAALVAFGRLDVVHANAGTPFTGPVEEVDAATLDRVVDVNLKGAFWTAQAAVPTMKAAGSGSILFTASLQAVIARPGYTPYTAAKHGVIGLMKGLALELAPHGIRVNAIAPAATETPMLAAFLGGMGDVPDDALENFRRSIPLGRMATPLDTANAAVFLASDEARMITGHTLVLDGGTTAG